MILIHNEWEGMLCVMAVPLLFHLLQFSHPSPVSSGCSHQGLSLPCPVEAGGSNKPALESGGPLEKLFWAGLQPHRNILLQPDRVGAIHHMSEIYCTLPRGSRVAVFITQASKSAQIGGSNGYAIFCACLTK